MAIIVTIEVPIDSDTSHDRAKALGFDRRDVDELDRAAGARHLQHNGQVDRFVDIEELR